MRVLLTPRVQPIPLGQQSRPHRSFELVLPGQVQYQNNQPVEVLFTGATIEFSCLTADVVRKAGHPLKKPPKVTVRTPVCHFSAAAFQLKLLVNNELVRLIDFAMLPQAEQKKRLLPTTITEWTQQVVRNPLADRSHHGVLSYCDLRTQFEIREFCEEGRHYAELTRQ